ncbi:hypothetical protein KXR87_09155 [Yokenella regensburgei]|uniref:hypothetical protein n=1 Tax=Enterobacteriaceae TaxID=543 RepID=UPI0011C0D042|nr:hypothetical protein [Leclercia adecarboxylata]
MEIKSIKFEWNKELENPLYKTYRVVCTIVTKADVTVSGSTDGRIESTDLSSDIFRALRLDRHEEAEHRAFLQANEMLFYATGERCYERPRRHRED